VCGGEIIGGPVHIVFMNDQPVYLCEADFILGTEAAKSLTTMEVRQVILLRANPRFRGRAVKEIEKAFKRRGRA
jgi:hypothetical protein